MFGSLVPLFLSEFIYERLQSALLLKLRLHFSSGGVVWTGFVTPTLLQIVKGTCEGFDLQGVEKTKGMCTDHVIE